MLYPDSTLLLIGHGSTVNGDSGATVYQHAAELRRRGIFAEVREAFFKIEPHIGPVLASIRTPRIFVVPLFVSEGYFTRQAIPVELGIPPSAVPLLGGVRGGFPETPSAHPPVVFDLGGRTLYYCAPVGTHPLMTQVILARAREVLGAGGLREAGQPTPDPSQEGNWAGRPTPDPSQEGNWQSVCGAFGDSRITHHASGTSTLNPQRSTALVIAGHGTELSPDSRKSVERQVELIAAQKLFAEVHPAFLEEEPCIAAIPHFVVAPNIIVVPFFMSDGLHVCEDIPVLLGESREVVQARLAAGKWPWENPTECHGKRIFYTRGVGSEPGIADVILERARAAATS